MPLIAVTGHRPEKLGGYSADAQYRLRLFAERVLDWAQLKYVKPNDPLVILTGMAQGWDTAIAQGARYFGIPYIAYVPCAGQSSQWPFPAHSLWLSLLKDALAIVQVSDEPYRPELMHMRNRRMIDDADRLIGLRDPQETTGGTAAAIHYADSQQVPRINLWDTWVLYCKQYSSADGVNPMQPLHVGGF